MLGSVLGEHVGEDPALAAETMVLGDAGDHAQQRVALDQRGQPFQPVEVLDPPYAEVQVDPPVVVPPESSSASAIIGARPVPPPRSSTSRCERGSQTMDPTGGPRRTTSPTRLWCTSAEETQPASIAFTCRWSRPSAAGAFAME